MFKLLRASTCVAVVSLLSSVVGATGVPVTLQPDSPIRDEITGWSVAIDGNLGAVGGPGSLNEQGGAYLFNAQTGDQLWRFEPPTRPSTLPDFFGFDVGVTSDFVLVSDPGNPFNDQASLPVPEGQVYKFSTTTGNLIDTWTASNGADNNEFGFSMDVSGTRAVVGATKFLEAPGSVYVYDVNTNTELLELQASDARVGDNFGYSSAIDGNLAIVGAIGLAGQPGAAYVFDVNTGDELHRFAPGGPTSEGFGWSVDVFGDKAIVGTLGNRSQPNSSAYVYDLTDGSVLHDLESPTGNGIDELFGNFVAIDENFAYVSAPGDFIEGSLHIFDLNSGDLVDTISAPAGGKAQDFFSATVRVDDGKIITGAPLRDPASVPNSGLTFVFDAPEPPPSETCGDFDMDGDVDAADRTIQTINWTGALFPAGTGDSTFAEGDCDGDGDVDTADQNATILNWTGALMAGNLADGDNADLIYDPATGEVVLDGSDTASGMIISFVVGSEENDLRTENSQLPFVDTGTNTDNETFQIGQIDPLNQGSETISLGAVLPTGITTAEQLSEYLSIASYASELGQGGEFDLRVVPEPSTGLLLLVGVLGFMIRGRR